MTVDVERVYDVDASVEDVWAKLSDPAFRAEGISVVDSYEVDGDDFVWHVRIPVPGLRKTVAVRTRDVERDPPRYVKFEGRAPAMHVTGEHELTPTENGCRVRNRFRVDGSLPGLERFFTRRLDDEIEGMLESLGTGVSVQRVR